MSCLNCITLKNGYTVPCGKCAECMSKRRNEWSVRLQLHSATYNKMPLFVTLTYNNDHLVRTNDEYGTLVKSDISLFLKRYKDRYNLYNTRFSYFGCGEYGDDPRFTHRPHYHLILWGDLKLQELFNRDSKLADLHVEACWRDVDGNKIGNVRVFQAEWSGIHYVTKYVLKDDSLLGNDFHEARQEPFTIWSHGLGVDWLNTQEAQLMKRKLTRFAQWKDDIYSTLPDGDFVPGDLYGQRRYLEKAIKVIEQYLPNYKVQLPSGEFAYLPSFYRRRLKGSFEKPSDNPLFMYNHLKNCLHQLDLIEEENQSDRERTLQYQKSLKYTQRVISRIIINRNKKHS